MQPTADSTRKPHRGSTRCLVIAIDVGTTFSGVSYAILEPGEVPKIHGVTRFPGQEHVAGNSKIPSIMYYDKSGNMKAAGAEAESASIVSRSEDEGWAKTELFKLRLRPRSMKLDMNGMRLTSLPRNKSATQVFGDFLSYLFHCTRDFIKDTHANGAGLWHAVEYDIQFVLSHPNGWEGAQQMKIRKAAIYGGLIPNTNEGKARIRFVTEGEASLHACVLNGLAADVLSNPSNPGFIVVDAGGGTLDISSYAIRGTSPLVIEEIAPPDCIFAGSVFVSHRARGFLTEKLKNSKYGSADSVDHITKKFDETTKRLFRDRKEPQYIVFGSPFDKDQTLGIRSGQLKLTGNEVAELFEPSVEAAVSSIKAQIDASAGLVKSVWLVGGFAASPYLFKQLQERLAPMRVTVSRPDSQTSKAVADGAIGFYCDHHVSARMSKYMYGVEYLREYDPKDPDHVARKTKLCELPSGPKLLPDAFDCILSRRIKVKESTVFSRKYCTELTSLTTLSFFEVDVWCYRGGDTIPKWIHRQADEFSTLCVVRADLSPLTGSAKPKQGKNGKTYWTVVFSVEIQFGLTEFKARIKWVENGETKYGPATIVYNESGHRTEDEEPDSSPEDEGIPHFGDSSRHASGQHSRGPSVSTPGHVTSSTLKAVSASGNPDISVIHHTESPRIEHSTSKTGPPSPHPLPKADRESTRKEETVKEKSKAKDVTGRAAADKGYKEEPLASHSWLNNTDYDDVGREENAKDKGKSKDSAISPTTDKKNKKGAKQEKDDVPKFAEVIDFARDPVKSPITPKETTAESPTIVAPAKETVAETSKDKKKASKDKNKNAGKTSKDTVKSVGFVLPTDDDYTPDPPKISPTKTKSSTLDAASSHSTKHTEHHIGDRYETNWDAGETTTSKNDPPLARTGLSTGDKSSFGFNEFDWEDKGDNDMWGANPHGSVGESKKQTDLGFSWGGAGAGAGANLGSTVQQQTGGFDNYEGDANLDGDTWDVDLDQTDPLPSSHRYDSYGGHSTTADHTGEQYNAAGASHAPTLSMFSGIEGDSAGLFGSDNIFPETTSPLDDKFGLSTSAKKSSTWGTQKKSPYSSSFLSTTVPPPVSAKPPPAEIQDPPKSPAHTASVLPPKKGPEPPLEPPAGTHTEPPATVDNAGAGDPEADTNAFLAELLAEGGAGGAEGESGDEHPAATGGKPQAQAKKGKTAPKKKKKK